jgi:hypothetical protein
MADDSITKRAGSGNSRHNADPGFALSRAAAPFVKQQHQLELTVLPQRDDTTCGPTCLEAVYRYHGYALQLDKLIADVVSLPYGGTLAVWLACHALGRGFEAEIYTYNLHLFDPTWFNAHASIAERLRLQRKHKRDRRTTMATEGYLEFLELGGALKFKELNAKLIRGILNRERPIITGLSATYLYDCAREYSNEYDDARGVPTGHFVVLSGYDRAERQVSVADPLQNNPKFASHYYNVGIDRLIGAILLGVLTHDANLLVIYPKDSGA